MSKLLLKFWHEFVFNPMFFSNQIFVLIHRCQRITFNLHNIYKSSVCWAMVLCFPLKFLESEEARISLKVKYPFLPLRSYPTACFLSKSISSCLDISRFSNLVFSTRLVFSPFKLNVLAFWIQQHPRQWIQWFSASVSIWINWKRLKRLIIVAYLDFQTQIS